MGTNVAVVTGATGKIGQVTVKNLLDEGYIVLALTRSVEKLQKLFPSPSVIPFICDLSNLDIVATVAKDISKNYNVEVLINNAAVDIDQPYNQSENNDIIKLININLIAPMLLTKEIIKNMRENGGGRIINISSVLGTRPCENAVAYATSKSGIEGFTKSLAVEYGKYGVLVNSIAIGAMPGLLVKVNEDVSERSLNEGSYSGWEVQKEKIPLRRKGNFQEFADAINFLISDNASFITGVVLPVDGGILAQQ